MKTDFFKKAAFSAALALLAGGCYFRYAATSPTVQDTVWAETGEEVVEHLFVENYGWYLFYTLPICCGDDNEENSFPLEFFSDRCTPEVVKARFYERVKELGDDVEVRGLSFVNSGGVTFDVPGLSFPLVIPYVLCTRDIELSGTIVRRRGGEGVGGVEGERKDAK